MPPSALHQRRMAQFIAEVTVYPVSCEALAAGRTDEEWLTAVLAGGARIVQLRDKKSSDQVLLAKAKRFRQLTATAGALLIVNNRVDIALLAEADGVHLGNSDIPAQEARKLGPDLIIGISANTEEQAATAAARGGSYFNIGPLFPTQTKEGLSSFLGPEAIPTFAARSSLPFTVMGGIKFHHLEQLSRHQAQHIAVVTALSQAPDIAAETHRWATTIAALRAPRP